MNLLPRALTILLAGLVAGCSDSAPTSPSGEEASEARASYPPTHTDVWTSGAPLISHTPSLDLTSVQPCGAGSVSDLRYNGEAIGTVSIMNDPSAIYVTFRTSDEWFISNTLLSISPSRYGIYQDSEGRASPWAFSRQAQQWPVVQEHTVRIPYSEYSVGAGETLTIAAVAGMVHPLTSDWNGAWEWLLVWGAGTPVHPSYPAETYATYTVQACAGGGPLLQRRGAITITFDDGWSSTYNVAFPVLREHGLEANAAVNPQAVEGEWSGYMHLPQLRELHSAGWSIVSHSWSHPNLTTLSAAELDRELASSKAWIEQQGFRGSNVFIVPFHSWGDREKTAIQRHYQVARGYSVNQFWPDSMMVWPAPNPYDITGYEPEYAPFTSTDGREKVRAYLERATREGRFVDFFFHEVHPAQEAAFRELVRIFADYQAVVRPYHELFPQ